MKLRGILFTHLAAGLKPTKYNKIAVNELTWEGRKIFAYKC